MGSDRPRFLRMAVEQHQGPFNLLIPNWCFGVILP